MEGDQLTIEAYWEPGDGTSPRWGEYGGELHSGPTVPRDRQDSGALVTPDSQSRSRCDGDFAQLRVAQEAHKARHPLKTVMANTKRRGESCLVSGPPIGISPQRGDDRSPQWG